MSRLIVCPCPQLPGVRPEQPSFLRPSRFTPSSISPLSLSPPPPLVQWAFTYVAIYGDDFASAGRSALRLFNNRGWENIIADNLCAIALTYTSIAVRTRPRSTLTSLTSLASPLVP